MRKKTDNEIKHDVCSELKWDTRTWTQKIDVYVTDGVVTLEGVVSSHAQKVAAQNAAHAVAGVTDVANNLFVKTDRHYRDTELAHAVRHALEWDVCVPHEEITSTVSDGWVTLEGRVTSLTARFDAEWAVEKLLGVSGVVNKLEIVRTEPDVKGLRHCIEKALERRADREAGNLTIDIADGEVDLRGRVHSWSERNAIVGSITHAPGVKKINDNLKIDPYF